MPSAIRFLVNPSSGGGRARRALGAVERAAAREGASVELSGSGADLTARARRAVDDGVGRLAVVGGDGTVHLALQAVAGTSCELAVVPTGRGDDFAVSLGVPRELDAAIGLARRGSARELDLLRVDRHGADPVWAGLYASFGLDSAVTHTANAQARWIPPSVTYILATLRTLAGFRAPVITVDSDAGRVERRRMFVTACNAPRYGGGMLIAPEAKMDDGLLDIVAAERISKWRLLLLFPRVFSGRHVDHPAISIVRSRRAHIAAEPSVLLGSDGEIEGEVDSGGAEVSVVRRAIRAVMPGG